MEQAGFEGQIQHRPCTTTREGPLKRKAFCLGKGKDLHHFGSSIQVFAMRYVYVVSRIRWKDLSVKCFKQFCENENQSVNEYRELLIMPPCSKQPAVLLARFSCSVVFLMLLCLCWLALLYVRCSL